MSRRKRRRARWCSKRHSPPCSTSPRATYPWVPVGLLMTDPFLSREEIARVDEPLLIVHGTDDRTVPVEQGRRLFALAHEPKKLAIIDGRRHGDLWEHGLWPIVLGFLRAEGVTGAP